MPAVVRAEPGPFGKYLLLERIAQGGMAAVWLACAERPDGSWQPLVLKRILPQHADEPSFVRMFINEAQLLGRLRHPNIARLYELGRVDGELFIAMEYVHGHDLAAVMQALSTRPQPLWPVSAVVWIARGIAAALGYAHRLGDEAGAPLGIVHRDVSPANVMLALDGQVRLLDFGIAKALDAGAERTRTGTLKGKFAYLAPELLEGAKPTPRSDVFAVGVVLHELLTMRRLFKGETDLETLARVRAAEVPPPSSLNPAVPTLLDHVCARALARAPEVRYPTAAELYAELDLASAELPFSAAELAPLLTELFPEPIVRAPLPPPRGASAGGREPSGRLPALVKSPSPATPAAADTAALQRRLLVIGGAAFATVLVVIFAWRMGVRRAHTLRTSAPTAGLAATGAGPLLNAGATRGEVPPASAPAGSGATGKAAAGSVTSGDIAPGKPVAGNVTSGDVGPGKPVTGNVTSGDVAVGRPGSVTISAADKPAASARAGVVRVHVSSTPAGAEVTVGGERRARGRTPLDLELARAAMPMALRVSARGFAPAVLELSGGADTALHAELQPLSRAHTRSQHHRAPNLVNGDTVDPFRR